LRATKQSIANPSQIRTPTAAIGKGDRDQIEHYCPTDVGVARARGVRDASPHRDARDRPVCIVERASYRFEITRYKGPNPRLRSVLTIICAGNDAPLRILSDCKALLRNHAAVAVEVALDAEGGTTLTAPESLLALVGQLVKPRQRRPRLRVEHRPDRAPPLGCLPEPTYYLEAGRSTVKQKVYARERKLAGGGHGEPHVRLEWTLTGKRAITRHLGGNTIENLLSADLDRFIERNLRLEQVDHVTLGYVLRRVPANRRPRKPSKLSSTGKMTIRDQWRDPDFWARQVTLRTLRGLAHRELKLGHYPDFQHALATCQHSPAQIRAYLKELRDGTRPRRRGRPRNVKPARRPITDYQINSCFRKLKPTRV
jgi:hypothetical protein